MEKALETVRDDDFVEYFLFVRRDDSAEDAEELVKRINQLNARVLELVDRMSDQYIWHKDPFNLIPRFSPSAELRQSFSDASNGNRFSIETHSSILIFFFRFSRSVAASSIRSNSFWRQYRR